MEILDLEEALSSAIIIHDMVNNAKEGKKNSS